MFTVVRDEESSNGSQVGASAGVVSVSMIDEIVREGARAMLAAALRGEVAACVEAHAGEVDADGRRLVVVRNGSHQPREVLTSAVR